MTDQTVEESLDDLTLDEARIRIVQLRRAVSSHELVGQAVGVLLATYRITPERAWHILRTTSQRTNTKLVTLARAVVESAANLPPTDPEASHLISRELLPRRESARARSRQIDGHPTPSAVLSPFRTRIDMVAADS